MTPPRRRSGSLDTMISMSLLDGNISKSCAIFIAIRGPQRACFWLAGVEAGETWFGGVAGALEVEQLSRLLAGGDGESKDRELAV